MILDLLPHHIPWRFAEAEHEAPVVRLLDALDAAEVEVPSGALPDGAREHLAALDTCQDGLASVVQKPSIEEPSFYLPGILRPLWTILGSIPFIGRVEAPSPRDFASKVLEVGALLGGDARLGIMEMVSGEESVGAHYAEVYPRALARLASLIRWAVITLEREGEADDFVAAHLVESVPRLAAARFERSRRVSWPSLGVSWELTSGLNEGLRGTEESWAAIDAQLLSLTDAIEVAEAEPIRASSDTRAAPGTLVFVPAKGVSVVVDRFGDFDVVAHWSRPTRPDTWYPARSLGVVDIELPHFFGPVPFEQSHADGRALEERLFEIRLKHSTKSGGFVQTVRSSLDQEFGLEMYTGRSYVDEDKSRTVDVRGTGEHALEAYWQELLVRCDPVLGRVALECAIRCADEMIAEGAKDFDLRRAYLVRACCAWVVGRGVQVHADAFAAAVVEHTEALDFSMLIGLAAFGRAMEIEQTLATQAWKDQVAKWRAEADDWSDLKTSNWAERALRIVRTVESLAATGLDEQTTTAIRSELNRPQSSHVIGLEDVLWLRLLHEWRDWAPHQIVLSSYFELPDFLSVEPIPRVPPPELAADVEALTS